MCALASLPLTDRGHEAVTWVHVAPGDKIVVGHFLSKPCGQEQAEQYVRARGGGAD